MNFLVLPLSVFFLLSGNAMAAEKIPDFSKYDFTKLEAKEVSVIYPKVAVTIWDRCTQCDCPETTGKVEFEETKEAITYRKTFQVVDNKFTVKGMRKDQFILVSTNTGDCKVDSIVEAFQNPIEAPPRKDKCCLGDLEIGNQAARTKAAPNVQPVEMNAGCASDGGVWFLIPLMVLMVVERRKVVV